MRAANYAGNAETFFYQQPTVIRWLRQSLRTCPFAHIWGIMFRFSSLIALPLFSYSLYVRMTYWCQCNNKIVHAFIHKAPLRTRSHVCFQVVEWFQSGIYVRIFRVILWAFDNFQRPRLKLNTVQIKYICLRHTDLKTFADRDNWQLSSVTRSLPITDLLTNIWTSYIFCRNKWICWVRINYVYEIENND